MAPRSASDRTLDGMLPCCHAVPNAHSYAFPPPPPPLKKKIINWVIFEWITINVILKKQKKRPCSVAGCGESTDGINSGSISVLIISISWRSNDVRVRLRPLHPVPPPVPPPSTPLLLLLLLAATTMRLDRSWKWTYDVLTRNRAESADFPRESVSTECEIMAIWQRWGLKNLGKVEWCAAEMQRSW